MPSIKATRKRQEQINAAKVKEEEDKDEANGSSDEGDYFSLNFCLVFSRKSLKISILIIH